MRRRKLNRTLLGLLLLGILVTSFLQVSLATQGEAEQLEILLDRGHTYLGEGKIEAAHEAFSEALELFRAQENQQGEAEALRGLGIALQQLGNTTEALLRYEEALGIAQSIDDQNLEAWCYMEIGFAHRQIDEMSTASIHFELARAIFAELSDQDGEIQALRELASSGDASSAIEWFQEILGTAKHIGDRALEAWCQIDLGNAYMQLGDLTPALEHFGMARESFVALSDREGEIEALRSEGNCLLAMADGFRLTNPTEAISVVQRSLRAFRDAEDEQGEGNALMTLAGLYQTMNQNAKAFDYAEQAENLFRSIGDHLSATWALNLLSSCHYALDEYAQSLEAGERALRRFRSLGDAAGEASALVSISFVHEIRGEFQQAIDCCLLALSIYQDLGLLLEVASTLERLGAYYSSVGEVGLSAEVFEQSLDLARMLDVPWMLANALHASGQSHINQGDFAAAMPLLEEALIVFCEMGNSSESDCLISLVNCYMSTGRLEDALETAEEIVAIGQAIGIQRIECNVWMSLGNLQLLLGRTEEGIESFEQSLKIAQEIDARNIQTDLCRQLADVFRSLGRVDEARTFYEIAIEGTERTFGDLSIESLQEAFFPRVRELYIEYFRLLMEMGETDETLWVAERCRARTYVEQVGRADIGLLDLLPETGIRSGVISAVQVERDAREAIDNLPTNTAAIEYFVTDEKTFVWVLRDGTIYGPRQIDVAKAALQRQVVAFRTSIEAASQGMSSRPDDELLAMARELHQLLIAPIAEWLDGIEHIVIVPSGPLYYLPFSALVDCPECEGIDFLGGEYLIERYSITYTPSLSTLHFIQQRDGEGQGQLNLLAFADPASGDASMPRLPEAQEEAQAIALLFNESEVFVDTEATEDVLRQSVTNAGHLLLSTHGWFDAGNPMYSYLMLTPTATSDGRLHTYEVFELPLNADLVTLSACETLLPALNVARDTERLARGLAEDAAVILSNEQLDELTTGDDVVGLTRAFLYAGSSSVLSTLWRVVSETTEQLMVAFYGYMEAGLNKAGALRQAQLDVMASYPHPRYWAAFELIGDWW